MADINTEANGMTMENVVEGMDKNAPFRLHQVITATIVSATDEEVYVSVSGKQELRVSKDELDCETYTREAYAARVGEDLELMVTSVSSPVRLSEKAVKRFKEEQELLSDVEAGKEFSVVCTGTNKGGLTAQLGTYPVFVRASEIRPGYVKELDKYVGKTLRLRMLVIRKGFKKEIVASQRVILMEERTARDAEKEAKENAFFDSIEVDAVVEGKVERITKFGAFVSVNGFDCLAHISDLSWSDVKTVDEVLEIGKTYQFKVLKIDRENKKVSIGYKQLQPEPWELAAEKYAVGDVIHGKVVRIMPYGAFVEIEKGVDGLVHVSQITHEWLENPTSALNIGDEVDAKILAFNVTDHRITLSIKALQPRPEYDYQQRDNDRDGGRKSRKGGKKNYTNDDEYTEWSDDTYGGVSIGDLIHKDDDK